MPTTSDLAADICLIGAGAAGITIAQALADSGLEVILLESGGVAPEEDTQALYAGEASGHPMDVDVGRYRILGGSTSQWTGRCATFDSIDFERRDWVPHSGWPIGRADLDPWYARAQRVCGFPEPWIDDDAALRALGVTPVHEADLDSFVWRYAPVGRRQYRNWGVEYRRVLETSPNVRTLLHANVTDWHASDDGAHVAGVTARALTGQAVRVTARRFVLCAGGLENARLLLASTDSVPGGLGSGHDNVGRFFMQHPRGTIGTLAADPARALRLQDEVAIFEVAGGIQYESGWALSERAQREHRLLNASVIPVYQADPDSGWEATKRLLARDRSHGGPVRDLRRVAADPVPAVRNLWRKGVQKRHAAYPLSRVDLLIDLEQRPDPDSRVTLAADRDALGMRRPRVHWTMSDDERRTSRVFADLLDRHFASAGIGRVTPAAWLADSGPIGDELQGTYHHIATTRMADSPRDGVVDRDCRVHGVDNLYVAGCSTFATGAHANPTFTIIAMALRLADHLQQDAM